MPSDRNTTDSERPDGIHVPGSAPEKNIALVLIFVSILSLPLHAQNIIHPSYADSVEVSDIRIEGNDAFGDATITEIINTQETASGFSQFMYGVIEALGSPPQYFDYDTFKKDAEAIGQLYKNNGFFECKVDYSYEYDEDTTGILALFDIAEGGRSKIDSINYRNLGRLDSTVYANLFENRVLKVGQDYSAARVESEAGRIIDILRNNGYPRARRDSIVVERKLSNNNVTVKYTFEHGKQLYFGNVVDSTIGDDEIRLARKVLEQRLEFQKGDVYSVQKRQDSEANLLRLGIFRRAEVEPQIPPIYDTITTTVPIIVIMEARNKYDLTPAIIAKSQNSVFKLGSEIGFVWRNAFAEAQEISAKVGYLFNIGGSDLDPFDSQEIFGRARYEQPFFIDNSNSLSFELAYTSAFEKGLYDGTLAQSVLGVRRRFTSQVTGSADYTLEQLRFEGDPNNPSPISGALRPGEDVINYRNSLISFSLSQDRTNDFFNPSAGDYIRGTVEEAGALATIFGETFTGGFQSTKYVKGEVLAKRFYDLSDNKSGIVGLKLKVGGIFRYGDSKSNDIPVPFNRRYYGGGATGVRGWGSRKLVVDTSKVDFGSNATVEASIEYRWRLFPGARKWLALEPSNLMLVLFADAGNVWNEFYQIRL
ncbi:MAG: hypothetical protein CL946_08805, partial [Ectothiorhodospiraceae bacterium]|nr:hypothetical protein [Ectothiorhodospiraceae bacterium]